VALADQGYAEDRAAGDSERQVERAELAKRAPVRA
jgi:hypothetical protein